MSQEDRAELLDRIRLEAHGGMDERVEETWKVEVRRRVEEIRSGEAKGIPVDDALADMRKRLKA